MSFFFSVFSSLKYDHYYCTEFFNNSSTSLLFTRFQSLVPSNKILNYFVLVKSLIAVILFYFKFHCFGFIFILLFLSGDILLNPGPVSLNNWNASSPLDEYKPFSSLTAPNLRIATLNSKSVLNKSAIINNHILENKIDFLCIAET